MAPALTAGATTTEPQYLQVPDSAGARPMHPPARAPGSADCIGRATNTTDTTHTTRSANTHELTILYRTLKTRRAGLRSGTVRACTNLIPGPPGQRSPSAALLVP